MKVTQTMSVIFQAIIDEADRNPEFEARLKCALGPDHGVENEPLVVGPSDKRRHGRRTPALFDPIELARQGEGVLRSRLSSLDLEQLRDIVAQFGMDPGKLVMKWKNSARVVDRITQLALARATKGDAFRSD